MAMPSESDEHDYSDNPDSYETDESSSFQDDVISINLLDRRLQ